MLIPHSDPQSIADSVVYLKNNPIISSKMGEEGFLRASSRYGIDTYTNSLENLYLTFINKRNK